MVIGGVSVAKEFRVAGGTLCTPALSLHSIKTSSGITVRKNFVVCFLVALLPLSQRHTSHLEMLVCGV